MYGLYIVACVAELTQQNTQNVIISNLLVCLLFAGLFMAGLFVVAHRAKRYDMVDVGWGLCFIVVASTSYVIGSGGWVQTLTTLAVQVWGLRLAWHIGRRVRRSTHEDERYVELRKNWQGSVAVNTFFRVYMVQAILAVLISAPVMYINLAHRVSWSLLAVLGLAVWLLGFVCEVVADKQLAAFIAEPNNKGKLMTTGLWKYARYPNYFGELTMWWGLALVPLGMPYGWVGLGGAALISYLIIYISGIPPKEARLRTRQGWSEYVQKTRLLAPLPRANE